MEVPGIYWHFVDIMWVDRLHDGLRALEPRSRGRTPARAAFDTRCEVEADAFRLLRSGPWSCSRSLRVVVAIAVVVITLGARSPLPELGVAP